MGFAIAGLATAVVGLGLSGAKMGMDMQKSGQANAAGAIDAQLRANDEEDKLAQVMYAQQGQGAEQVSQNGDAMMQLLMAGLSTG